MAHNRNIEDIEKKIKSLLDRLEKCVTPNVNEIQTQTDPVIDKKEDKSVAIQVSDPIQAPERCKALQEQITRLTKELQDIQQTAEETRQEVENETNISSDILKSQDNGSEVENEVKISNE